MNIPPPEPFSLQTADDGTRHATGGPCSLNLSILPDGESKLFHRNAIKKKLATGNTEHIRWLVAELNGVRVYVDGTRIVVTTRDILP